MGVIQLGSHEIVSVIAMAGKPRLNAHSAVFLSFLHHSHRKIFSNEFFTHINIHILISNESNRTNMLFPTRRNRFFSHDPATVKTGKIQMKKTQHRPSENFRRPVLRSSQISLLNGFNWFSILFVFKPSLMQQYTCL